MFVNHPIPLYTRNGQCGALSMVKTGQMGHLIQLHINMTRKCLKIQKGGRQEEGLKQCKIVQHSFICKIYAYKHIFKLNLIKK